MRRLEHPEGKFWSATIEGVQLKLRWGKVGTTGQGRDLQLDSESAARAKADELAAKQIALGYVDVADPRTIVEVDPDLIWFRRLEDQTDYIEVAIHGRRVVQRRGSLEEDIPPDFQSAMHENEADAQSVVRTIVERAVMQGYIVMRTEVPDAVLELDSTPEPLVVAENPELEAQCRAAPDHAPTWAVYADWLMTQGDPRGELAALRVKLPDMLVANWLQLCGNDEDVAEYVKPTSWRHGFVSGVSIKIDQDVTPELADITRAFLATPVARFVEELRFGLAGFESNNDWGPTMEAITSSVQAPWIRALRFDDFTYEEQEISWTAFGDFSAAWEKLPRLEELRIRAGAGGTLGEIVLPELRTFVRVTGGLGANELESICTATWPKLEHLEVWFGDRNYGAEGDERAIGNILAGRGLPALRHLGLVNCSFSDHLIPVLAGSAILRQIQTLDLSSGVMAGVATRELVANANAFRHLKSINLDQNVLLDDELDRIAGVLPNIVRGEQRDRDDLDDDDDDTGSRYVALGE